MSEHDDDKGGAPPALGDAPMRAAVYAVAGCSLLFAGIALVLVDARTGAGVLIGGAIATLNLLVFAHLGQAFLSRRGKTVPWAVVAVLKLLLLFGGVSIIVKSGAVSAVSLAVGYAALPFGVTLASLFGPKPKDEEETESAQRRRDVVRGPRHDGSDGVRPDEPGSPPDPPDAAP
jgi:hypothetical protein